MKNILFLVFAIFTSNGFAITATALQSAGKIQNGLNGALEEQYVMHEKQNLITEQRILKNREVLFNIKQKQQLLHQGNKAEILTKEQGD